MSSLSEILVPYIIRFREQYNELEKKTGNGERTGSQRREWMKNRVQTAFSRESIEKLQDDEAIDILCNFYSIEFGTRANKGKDNHRKWAAELVKRGFIEKSKILLYGENSFPERYANMVEISGLNHGILSEFLCYYDPQKYGSISGSSINALKNFGFQIVVSKNKKNAGEYALDFFEKLQKVLKELRKDPFFSQADLLTLDYFLYFVAQARYWRIAGGRDGALWKDKTWQKMEIASYGNSGIEKELRDRILQASVPELKTAYSKAFPEQSAGNRAEKLKLLNIFLHKVQIGDILLVNQGKTSVLGYGIVKSDPKYSEKYPDFEFTVYRDMVWVKEDLRVPIPEDFQNQFSQTISGLSNKSFRKLVGGVEMEETDETDSIEKLVKVPKDYQLNRELLDKKKQIILYGPPGTGKTYKSVIKANEIIFRHYDPTITYRLLQEKLQSQQKNQIDISQLSWIEAIMLAFDEIKKENVQVYDIKKSKIIQDFSSYKNNHYISHTIWSMLQAESKLDSATVKLKNKSGREYFDKDKESNWYLTEKGKDYQKHLIEDLNDYPETSDSQFSFITFHQSFSYEDFVEGIRPELNRSDESTIEYRIKDGIFKEICKKAAKDPTNNYVLIIDEINRGNISKIFGELITLLEDNKRMGEKEEITVRLPYSNESFSVPNNVYIIGTMNSTDKSIALVDIALRRRFHFERLNVDYDLIQNNDAKVFLKELNSIICAIKNPDYEIGHYYFMNIPETDQENQELKKVFSNQILPLLEEYFFNDWEALATILGRDSIKIEKRKKFVWDEDSGKFEEDGGDYDQIFGRYLRSSDIVFENAMRNLGIKTNVQEIKK